MAVVYQTVGLLLALAVFALTLWLFLALRPWHGQPEVRAWLASYGALTLGVWLYLVPEHGPGIHLAHYLGRNSFLMWSAGLQWLGSAWMRTPGRPPFLLSLWPLALHLPLTLLLKDTLQGRALAFSLAAGPVFLLAAWSMGRVRGGPLARAAAWILAAHGAYQLLRGLVILLTWGRTDLMLWVAVSFIEAMVAMAALAIVLWMLVESRDHLQALPGERQRAPVD